MKKLILTAVFAMLFTVTATFASGEGWVTDWEAAKSAAGKGKMDMLVDFSGSDWCQACILLNEEVFMHKEFKDYAKANFVLVEIDFPRRTAQSIELKEQNNKLQSTYDVKGFPTVMLMDAKGVPYARTGYVRIGLEKYITHLKQLQTIRTARDEAFANADKADVDFVIGPDFAGHGNGGHFTGSRGAASGEERPARNAAGCGHEITAAQIWA